MACHCYSTEEEHTRRLCFSSSEHLNNSETPSTIGLLSGVGKWDVISIRQPQIPRPWNPTRAPAVCRAPRHHRNRLRRPNRSDRNTRPGGHRLLSEALWFSRPHGIGPPHSPLRRWQHAGKTRAPAAARMSPLISANSTCHSGKTRALSSMSSPKKLLLGRAGSSWCSRAVAANPRRLRRWCPGPAGVPTPGVSPPGGAPFDTVCGPVAHRAGADDGRRGRSLDIPRYK
jgi:hypothetical protein